MEYFINEADKGQAYEKLNKLRAYLKDLGKIAIAFSGGVDSTFLLKVAHSVLKDDVVALTAASCLFPERETCEAVAFCKNEGISQTVIETNPFSVEGFDANPMDRCYLCKRSLFEQFKEAVQKQGFHHVAEGSNMDDLSDYRPGLKAIGELGILSPLRSVGLYKSEIRFLSMELGLDTFEKPSFACLASRIAHGEEITRQKLTMIDKAEQLLYNLGFLQFRVRIHGTIARIELLPGEFHKILDDKVRLPVLEHFRELGFNYVSLDLQGYRAGSMNRIKE